MRAWKSEQRHLPQLAVRVFGQLGHWRLSSGRPAGSTLAFQDCFGWQPVEQSLCIWSHHWLQSVNSWSSVPGRSRHILESTHLHSTYLQHLCLLSYKLQERHAAKRHGVSCCVRWRQGTVSNILKGHHWVLPRTRLRVLLDHFVSWAPLPRVVFVWHGWAEKKALYWHSHSQVDDCCRHWCLWSRYDCPVDSRKWWRLCIWILHRDYGTNWVLVYRDYTTMSRW